MNTFLLSTAAFDFGEFLHEVVLHGFLDTLKIAAFLFLAYLFMEFIEHKASDKLERAIGKAGAFGPLIGASLGALPQCGFSAVAANFYTGGIVSMGALVAVFLSTSDEMIAIMISGKVSAGAIFAIIGYKLFVGIIVGFAVDFALSLMRVKKREIDIDSICENDNCHCERGIFFSALHHTLTVGSFVLLISLLLNGAVYAIGEERLADILYAGPFVGHLISALLGLVPNCAISVLLTTLCVDGYITAGMMMSGLFSGAGVGLLVLFRVNKNIKENLAVTAIIFVSGLVFGLLADAIGFSALI